MKFKFHLNNYVNHCVDWFQHETIIIFFIEQLISVNYIMYYKIITILHNKLISNVKNLLEQTEPELKEQNDKEYEEFGNNNPPGHIYGKEYFKYLIDNEDLTKLKPTENFEFMYIAYYYDLNNTMLNGYFITNFLELFQFPDIVELLLEYLFRTCIIDLYDKYNFIQINHNTLQKIYRIEFKSHYLN
jgi:hypothetical protein